MNEIIVNRCKSCPALCCVVAGEIDITLEEGQILSAVSGLPLESILLPINKGKKYILQKGIGLSCIFLDKNSCCTVYLYRPKTCREYTCQGDPIIYQLWRTHKYVRNNPNYTRNYKIYKQCTRNNSNNT